MESFPNQTLTCTPPPVIKIDKNILNAFTLVITYQDCSEQPIPNSAKSCTIPRNEAIPTSQKLVGYNCTQVLKTFSP